MEYGERDQYGGGPLNGSDVDKLNMQTLPERRKNIITTCRHRSIYPTSHIFNDRRQSDCFALILVKWPILFHEKKI